MSYSRDFAEFIQDTSFESLPEEVKKAAQWFILDLLGVMYAGSNSESAKVVDRVVKRSRSRGESTVIPFGFKTSCIDAALINGTFANGVSLNDIHFASAGHLGPVVIPAVLAVGEKTGASGRDIITAVTIGYEIMGRVGKAVHTSHQERGFHPTATCGVFGAAAAASKLLGLNVEESIWALGNAGTQASGLYAFLEDGAMTITVHTGIAARNGIFAALLAQEGFTGGEYIFEGKGGFLKAMADTFRPEDLCDGLGEDYEILNTGFKPYACCRLIHSSIDAMMAFSEKHGHLEPERIKGIVVRVSPAAANQAADYTPQTPVGARFSLPFNVARLLLVGRPPVEAISEEQLRDENIRRLSSLVKIVPGQDFSRYTSEVEITTTDGEVFFQRVEFPKGDPRNPLTPDEIIEKFRVLVQGNDLGEDRIREIIAAVDHLGETETISAFIEKLVNK